MPPDPALRTESIRVVDDESDIGALARRGIENLIESVLGLDAGEVHAAARLREDFGVDFLDLLELALAMEAELGVKIPNRALEGVTTVDELIRLAGKPLAPAPPKPARRRDPGARPPPEPRRRRAAGIG